MEKQVDGFTFTGTGTLDRIDTFETKSGKAIVTLIFRQDGQYPQLIPIKVFGKLADEAPDWKPGSLLDVRGKLGGRDWQGKVYPDIIATRVDVVSVGEVQSNGATPAASAPESDSVPF